MFRPARDCCFIVAAAAGDRREAGKIIRQAIRAVVGRDHLVAFYSQAALAHDGVRGARFVTAITDEQREQIRDRLDALARESGFDVAPVDVYHD